MGLFANTERSELTEAVISRPSQIMDLHAAEGCFQR